MQVFLLFIFIIILYLRNLGSNLDFMRQLQK